MASAHVIFGCDREVSSKGAPTLFAVSLVNYPFIRSVDDVYYTNNEWL